MTHGPNGMHASQPRHDNTRKALRVYEETHTHETASFCIFSLEHIVQDNVSSVLGVRLRTETFGTQVLI